MRPRGDDLGSQYRGVSTRHVEERDPFRVDPALVERGLAGHAETQNALAEALTQAESSPAHPGRKTQTLTSPGVR